jgi:hypothetical protein
MYRSDQQAWQVLTLAMLAWLAAAHASAAPPVSQLRTQRTGDVTYFHVRVPLPPDLRLPPLSPPGSWTEADIRQLGRLPRLVPQERHTRLVYLRLALPADGRGPVRATFNGALEFVGRVEGGDMAKLLLFYPTEEENLRAAAAADPGGVALPRPARGGWSEQPLTLSFRTDGGDQPRRSPAGKRDARKTPADDDLEGLWASAQAATFAVLEAQTSAFGFYGFARQATARKYDVAAPALVRRAGDNPEADYQRLYELTTGAEAIAEALQLHRLLAPSPHDRGQRTVPVAAVPGINPAERPWEKMMGGKKPAPDPLARLVPRDNYYLHFRSISKYLEFSDLLEQWGATTLQAVESNSRAYRLRPRYERQLCLDSDILARTVGPFLVRSVAVTGGDLNLREGSDVTVLVRVANRALFLAAMEPFIQAARQEFRDELRQEKSDDEGIAVESFVSPAREISLYRAVFDDVVVCSNSRAALRRVLDTKRGRRPPLADEPDFQYLRTIYPAGDEREDGFVCLSGAFICRALGPAEMIREKRRLEAITSLYTTTYAALFAAWEGGALPRDPAALQAVSGLRPEEVAMPEGKGAIWDGRRAAAVSDVYNTLTFATPLVELPIDHVTPAEERQYRRFREDYRRSWLGCSDPVGMRFRFDNKQVRVETHFLPLAQNELYRELQRWTGGGSVQLVPGSIPADALAQLLVHLSPEARQRFSSKPSLGEWAFVRALDGPGYEKLTASWLRRQLDSATPGDPALEAARLLFQLPVLAGSQVADRRRFEEDRQAIGELLKLFLGPVREEKQPAYRGVEMTRVQFDRGSRLAEYLNDPGTPREQRFAPTLYHAYVEDGWYLSGREELLKELADRAAARREGKALIPAGEGVVVNTGLYLAPQALVQARDAAGSFLEWESHRRALGSAPQWYALFRCRLLPEDLSEQTMQDVALHYFGYVPVSPDGALYRYGARADEVLNRRHGSAAQPQWHRVIDAESPLGQLLEEFRTVRVDLRFREDGLETMVTIERKGPRR